MEWTNETVAALIMVLSFSLLAGGNLVAGGFLFQIFLGTMFTQGVLLILGIIFVCAFAGGLFSVAYTDVIQAAVALVGSKSLIAFIGLNYGFTIPNGMGPGNLGQLTDLG
jgi:Na+/proline symporter